MLMSIVAILLIKLESEKVSDCKLSYKGMH